MLIGAYFLWISISESTRWLDLYYLSPLPSGWVRNSLGKTWGLVVSLILLLRILGVFSLIFGVCRRFGLLALLLSLVGVRLIHSEVSVPEEAFLGWLMLGGVLLWPALQRAPRLTGMWFRRAGWVVAAIAYLHAGIFKLKTPMWIDGSAIHGFLTSNHLVYSWLARPQGEFWLTLAKGLTWFTLLAEVAPFFLLFVPRGRFVAWVLMTMLHLGVLATMNLFQVSFGMLIFQFFLWDPRWSARCRRRFAVG